MYARTVDERTLTLAVSGMLWEGSLVMVDQETGSLWSHLLGEAVEGPLKGQPLEIIPSVMTDWQSWKARYPDSTLVYMPAATDMYAGEFYSIGDGLVLGLKLDKQTRAYPIAGVRQSAPVHDTLGGVRLVVMFHEPSQTMRAFRRELAGRVLDFEAREDGVYDLPTGSRWDPLTGQAVAGQLQGERLESLPGVVSDGAAWSTYYGGQMWQPEAWKGPPQGPQPGQPQPPSDPPAAAR